MILFDGGGGAQPGCLESTVGGCGICGYVEGPAAAAAAAVAVVVAVAVAPPAIVDTAVLALGLLTLSCLLLVPCTLGS